MFFNRYFTYKDKTIIQHLAYIKSNITIYIYCEVPIFLWITEKHYNFYMHLVATYNPLKPQNCYPLLQWKFFSSLMMVWRKKAAVQKAEISKKMLNNITWWKYGKCSITSAHDAFNCLTQRSNYFLPKQYFISRLQKRVVIIYRLINCP